MKIEFQKVYADIPEFSNKEYNDLNHFTDNNANNSLNDFSDEMTVFEILKLIENPEEHINSELPFILENLINSKKLDETNTNTILIADLSRVIIQHLKWVKCFPNIKPFYKVEANNNHELLRVIKKLGINLICNNHSDLSNILNLEVTENQIINSNTNYLESISKLNNSFRFNSSANEGTNSKVNSTQDNKESSTWEFTPTKIFFSTYVNAYDDFPLENVQMDNNVFSNNRLSQYEDKIDSYICSNIEEIKQILENMPSANIILRVFVNDQSEITRAEKNRLNKIFEISEELEFNINIRGLSLELLPTNFNDIGNYFNPSKIYEIIKRAREIIDQAEEYGIQIKILDIGSPENEAFLNEENTKLLNESLDYFFTDLKIEFISQLGKFFCAPAFSLLQKNIRKAFNLNINMNENINNDSSDNNLTITNSHSSSSSNLVGLNSTELSVNGNISAINQNSTYYLDLDFLPLEENNNLNLNNTQDSPNNLINKNFNDDFILNHSSILDSPTLNSKENVISLNNDIIIDENLNKFICMTNEFELNRNKSEESALNNKKNISDNNNKGSSIKESKLKITKTRKNSATDVKKVCKSSFNFEDDLKEEIKRINCKTKSCLKWKIDNFNNDSNNYILEDWFIFENVGNDNICKECKSNGYCKPEIYYINNRISIKLEKYFYVIMNKFDS